MKKEIYFHVGLAKTGSTFLQNNFFPYLKNIKYISTHKYRKCIKIINNTNYKSYLISREFDRQFEKEVKHFTKYFPQTKIIIVFRKHDKWISSQYKRYVKNGWHWNFEDFYKLSGDGYWKESELVFKNKLDLIKKYTIHDPLILNFDELKINPYSYLNKIVDYSKSSYNKDSISLNVIHKSFSEKQLLFLRSYCRKFKKNVPEYYADDKLKHWLFYRPWWLYFHLIMYFSIIIPKKLIINKPLINKTYLLKIKNKFKDDWKIIENLSK